MRSAFGVRLTQILYFYLFQWGAKLLFQITAYCIFVLDFQLPNIYINKYYYYCWSITSGLSIVWEPDIWVQAIKYQLLDFFH